ncbi:MAG TPA: alpha/beta fold hydrolase [Chloroflexota bacterium]|jgi:pimeloyl-ACP methyl ester carboxylesterase|nr:alpha/beta fold hydrolase [Chloroflexota bacterium]
MATATIGSLKVPGAKLHYEVRGSGPLLLMIPGGPADADVFAGIAPLLSDRYTVVTYDPRGNSRSELDGPPDDLRAAVHADDASRLLTAFTREPTYVFGSSGGAVVGLALAVEHPEQVRTLIAHEPPVTELLPEREHNRAVWQDIHETYRREGTGPAMARFLASAGLNGRQPAPEHPTDPEAQAAMGRMMRNIELFVAHGGGEPFMPDLPRYARVPRESWSPAARTRTARPPTPRRVALAERLGTHIQEFPGDHGGFIAQPDRVRGALARGTRNGVTCQLSGRFGGRRAHRRRPAGVRE